MLLALVVTAFGVGVHVPSVAGRVDPTKVAQTAPFGAPRRTMLGAAPYLRPEWSRDLLMTGIGGLLFVSACYFLNIALALVASRKPAPAVLPFAEALSGRPEHGPAILDRWRPWLALAVILIIIAYGPNLVRLAATAPCNAPGFRVW